MFSHHWVSGWLGGWIVDLLVEWLVGWWGSGLVCRCARVYTCEVWLRSRLLERPPVASLAGQSAAMSIDRCPTHSLSMASSLKMLRGISLCPCLRQDPTCSFKPIDRSPSQHQRCNTIDSRLSFTEYTPSTQFMVSFFFTLLNATRSPRRWLRKNRSDSHRSGTGSLPR